MSAAEHIALFGGSFDPPHNGHLQVLHALLESGFFSQVWVIPNGQSSLKRHAASSSDRYQMAQLAFSYIPSVSVLDVEMRRAPGAEACYTVDTVLQLTKNKKEQQKFFLILGSDIVRSFHLWKSPQRLLTLAEPYVFLRDGDTQELFESVENSLLRGAIIAGASEMRISSTEIRARLAASLSVSHLLPASVAAYIHKYQLYSSS